MDSRSCSSGDSKTSCTFAELEASNNTKLECFCASFREKATPSTTNSSKQKPSIGEGREFPPSLPNHDLWRVEFDFNDPLCAKNWPSSRKLTISLVLGYTAVVCGWGSSVYSAATEPVAEQFDKTIELSNLGTCLYIAGFASGPIIWGPLSELYGRKMPLLVSTFGCALFNTVSGASRTFDALMICRFFAGFIGAAPVSVSGGAFADMYESYGRGIAMVLFTGSIFVGPIIAPIIGSIICQSYLGWRWVQYITGIMGFLAFVLDTVIVKECYAPVILAKKAKALRNSTGNWGIFATHEKNEFDLKQIVTKTISRPLKMLFLEPIMLLVSVYTAFIYGMFYLYLEAYPIIFHTGYEMSRVNSTLPYLALAIGMAIGILVIILVFEPHRQKKLVAAPSSLPHLPPRSRLPPAIFGSIVFPIGIFWLTWTGHFPEKIHWLVPTSSGIFTGIGTILILIPCTNYVVDTYAALAASALAANASMRSGFGAAFPMFACAMFTNMGTGFAGTVIGGIALLLMPVPFIFYKFDGAIRSRSKFI